ncbi:MAG: hotdog family protein [Betaproteobacteria bacterium]|nr:hotdog family protein [Betaproteobacteria bacterium]
MRLDRAGIAARIPHQGSMCLLDRVLEWDADHIRCATESHRAADNPLRAHGRLGAACGIEYAAQAMAVHGALCAADGPALPPRRGMLTSVRGVALHVPRLDDVAAALIVQAERVSGDGGAAVYAFTLRAGERVLVEGRATVILDIETPGNPG